MGWCCITQLLQQHINRSQRRIARMKGVAPPSKRDLEHNLAKRLFIPPGGRPGTIEIEKRFNRQGAKSSVSLVEEDDEAPELESLAQHGDKLGKVVAAAKKAKGKGKGKGAAGANGTGNTGTGTGAAAAASNLTPANTPTTANSLGLAIECVACACFPHVMIGLNGDGVLTRSCASASQGAGCRLHRDHPNGHTPARLQHSHGLGLCGSLGRSRELPV